MLRIRLARIWGIGMLTVVLLQPTFAQKSKIFTVPAQPAATVQDAGGIRDELVNLLSHYPPTLRNVLALDPDLLNNESFLAPYPGLVAFLKAHPEIIRNPSYYLGDNSRLRPEPPARDPGVEAMKTLAPLAGMSIAVGLFVWLIRTMVDYRRWSRLAKVQTEAHTKLLDRFTANEDLLAYIRSPAGSKFLESSPISLDASPRALSAPLGRILWSLQGGLVVTALGIGLQVVSAQIAGDASQPLKALGVLAIALGLGFLLSAILSFAISRRLGLIELGTQSRVEAPDA